MNQPARTLYQNDQAALRQQPDYSAIRAIPELWPRAAAAYGDRIAMNDPHNAPTATLTYGQLWANIQTFASGLQHLGFAAGEHIALIADNSHRWFIADQGIMAAGGVDAVRSGLAETEEVAYIIEHSDSVMLVVEDLKVYERLQQRIAQLPLRQIILLSDETPSAETPQPIVNFPQLLELGRQQSFQPVTLQPDQLATLIYTSGTTGKPKGVMITHANLMHQVRTLGAVVQPQAGDRVLGLLPTWHTFGRTAEYFLYSVGASQTYTSIRHVKQDFREVKPQYMVGVPRLWESIYEGVQKQFREQPESKQKLIHTLMGFSQRYVRARRILQDLDLNQPSPSLPARIGAAGVAVLNWPGHRLGHLLVYKKVRQATGGQVKQLISGGGSLAPHLDLFFEILGVEILVGYGLTETSPVLSARRIWRNLRGASGQPIPETEIKVVDPETRQPLTQGDKGLVLARGPQVMQGYYKNPEATAKALDPEGWFDTGDLGWITHDGNVVLTGRAKDTIVLTNGENIEPQPIEDAIARSAYVDQVMVVGQDQRSLGAIIVPNVEALQKWAAGQSLHLVLPEDSEPAPPDSQTITLKDGAIQTLFRQELNHQVKDRPGFRPDDRIGPFELVLEPFSIDNGMLTQTLKVRRPVVTQHYQGLIDGMFGTP
jgi:long-chain acyl-CoA synthetase